MKILRVLALAAAAAVLCAAVFLLTAQGDISRDTVYINDVTETVRENLDDLSVLERAFPGREIMVFDTEGICIYPGGCDKKLRDVRGEMLCLAVTDGSVYLGTAALEDPAREQYESARKRLRNGGLLLLAVMLACGAGFYGYVQKNMIQPFHDLRGFAEKIAAGDLDSPLEMTRSNAFGKFTESFDIMREELKSARERENELKRREKELVASLSHDIRTPLAGIRTICDVLSVKSGDGYVLDKVATVSRKTEEIDLLVSDLLTASLEDMGELTVCCTDEPASVLGEILRSADTKDQVRQSEIPDCLISIDKKRMAQIINNILGNSYKYAGTPIDVDYVISGDFLKMSITDSGPGVEREELDLITGKFYRGRNAADRGGSGLGLYIASELMGKMRGELICSSRGKGLTVVLVILLS
ncbi:MAG: HAMP domain-containing histidine kinase [Oscillospiraceae bacterium]|nr:HAMP domain-containing histidine kinase [Oscillospiraceae bacterium]